MRTLTAAVAALAVLSFGTAAMAECGGHGVTASTPQQTVQQTTPSTTAAIGTQKDG